MNIPISTSTSDLFEYDFILNIKEQYNLIFVLDDLENNRCLFVDTPPGTNYWWCTKSGNWLLIDVNVFQ